MKISQPHETVAQRKAQLLTEGSAYRAGITNAVQEIAAGLPVQSLGKSAAAYLAAAGLNLFKSRAGLPGVSWQTAVPLLISGIAALSRKSLLKPVVGGALILGTAGMMAGIILRKKRAHASARAAAAPANE